MKAAFAFLIAGLALLAPAGAFAHHSFAAEYDTKKPVTLKGTVTSVEWTNTKARTLFTTFPSQQNLCHNATRGNLRSSYDSANRATTHNNCPFSSRRGPRTYRFNASQRAIIRRST